MKEYRKRVVDEILEKKLKGKGAVLIEGPIGAGKTTTAEQVANSILYMADPSREKQNIELSSINPKQLLDGDAPRLIDEWQVAPKLWDAVRFEVDHRNLEGQFILTGSAVPAKQDEIVHTGTGRFAWLIMRPMSLYESGESTGEVSLGQLFNAPDSVVGTNKLKIEDLAFLVCRGGWPRSVDMDSDVALEQAYDYYDAVVKSDISRVDGVKRDENRVRNLMRSYARNQGTQASNETLRSDMITNDNDSLDVDTIRSYLNALKKIFVIEEMQAWNPSLRSKTAIRTSNTRYFVDSSIAVAALGIGPKDLIGDLKTFGLLFETMCVRDLRVFAESLGGSLYHYRDKSGLECDTVLHLRNGKYGLIEIKLGGDELIEEGVENLKKFSSKIDVDKVSSPSFMMVLIGTGDYAYRREDGIYIVPIGCLKN